MILNWNSFSIKIIVDDKFSKVSKITIVWVIAEKVCTQIETSSWEGKQKW